MECQTKKDKYCDVTLFGNYECSQKQPTDTEKEPVVASEEREGAGGQEWVGREEGVQTGCARGWRVCRTTWTREIKPQSLGAILPGLSVKGAGQHGTAVVCCADTQHVLGWPGPTFTGCRRLPSLGNWEQPEEQAGQWAAWGVCCAWCSQGPITPEAFANHPGARLQEVVPYPASSPSDAFSPRGLSFLGRQLTKP